MAVSEAWGLGSETDRPGARREARRRRAREGWRRPGALRGCDGGAGGQRRCCGGRTRTRIGRSGSAGSITGCCSSSPTGRPAAGANRGAAREYGSQSAGGCRSVCAALAVRCVRDDGAAAVAPPLAHSRFSANSAESIKAIVHARLRQAGSSRLRSVLRASSSDFHIFGGGRLPHSPLVLIFRGRSPTCRRPRTPSSTCPEGAAPPAHCLGRLLSAPLPPPPSPPTQPPIFSIRGWSWGSHGALCVASSAHFLFSRGRDRWQPALHHHRGGGRRRLPQHGGARRRLRRPALRRHGQGRAGPLRSARAAFHRGRVLADRLCDPLLSFDAPARCWRCSKPLSL